MHVTNVHAIGTLLARYGHVTRYMPVRRNSLYYEHVIELVHDEAPSVLVREMQVQTPRYK